MEFDRQRRNLVKALVSGGVAVAGASALSQSASAVTPLPSARQTARARWRARSPLPVKRAEVGVAAVGGRLYVVGGTVQQGDEAPAWASTAVHSYDPRQDRWSNHAPLPRPLTHVGVAALGERLYAFGGFTGAVHMHPQPDAYVYDPHSDVWDRLPNMPVALGSIGVAAVGGKLHLLGGRDSHRIVTPEGSPFSLGFGTVRTHHVFDPRHNTYVTAEPLPTESRDHAGVAVLRDRIHIVGGRVEDVGDNLNRHDVYDVRSRRWTQAAPLPAARSAGAAVVLDGRIVYAGGECRPGSSTDTFGDVTLYDPRTERWIAAQALPGGRHGFGAAQLNGRAYFVAGSPSCGGGASADTLELIVSF
ncbi:kelch repeat-containing protein [Streptomyces sp. SRF1]|uniref:Kelch repeat-containing protein n=1 Tax=Streptomyces sp. SRF1 TaxID=1549642 RepID=UPI0025B07CCC|nr:kelch repeat-containing protein [Streptomyces sp. SRF1]MDN3056974.1 kelch repeat-containing protein [Streptomyces sp. SRF1]